MLTSDNVFSRTGVVGFVPDSGGFDLVSGFALFVEVATPKRETLKKSQK